MKTQSKPYLSSALWPGIVLGLLSAIPIINYGNLLCCIWVVGGGFLAALVFKQEYESIKPGEGAFVGLIAGIIGAIVTSIAAGIMWFFFGESYLANMSEVFSAGELDPAVFDMMIGLTSSPWLIVVVSLIIWALNNAIFATVGGLLGATFLKKRGGTKEIKTLDTQQDNENQNY